jgi:hypothetical protein
LGLRCVVALTQGWRSFLTPTLGIVRQPRWGCDTAPKHSFVFATKHPVFQGVAFLCKRCLATPKGSHNKAQGWREERTPTLG